jgi:hypothetical protein
VEFQRELLARLPLADSVFSLLGYLWSPSFLDRLFDAHRGRCYEQDLTFPRLVELVRDALLVHHGSGRASFEAADARGELPVLPGSVYQKLGRLPVELSQALLRETARRLPELLPPGRAASAAASAADDAHDPPLPASLDGLEVVALDGKVLKHVHRRLKPLRPLQGRLLGGRVLVALVMRPGLALAMNGCEDAERNDCPLVPGAVAQVRATVGGRDILFVADRQMCDLGLMALFAEGRDHFLVRYNRTLSFEPDPARPPQRGTDPRGRAFVQEWGWAGAASQRSRRRYVRRITLTRDGPGEEDVILVTDLLDERAYPAADLLEAYLRRWGIERVFQQVTEVFNLRHLIGTQPRATIFQAAFCFVLYNLVQVVRCYVARAGRRAAESVSTRKLFEDVTAELTAWSGLGETPVLLEHVRELDLADNPAAMRRHLRERLGKLWRDRWRKSPARPRPAAGQRRTVRVKGGRSSVWKVLQEHRERVATHKQKPRRC